MVQDRTLTRRKAIQGLATAGLLAACRPGGAPPGAGEAQTTARPVKLVFEWPEYTPPKKAWAEWAIQTYQKANPHVTIEPLWNTNPTEKILTTLAGGGQLDLGWFGVGIHAFWQNFKAAEPLMSSRKLKLSDYFPTIVEAQKFRGKMLAMPMGLNTTAVFYNKQQLNEVGERPPADDWTWEEAIARARRLTRGEGGSKIWGIMASFYSNFWPVAYGGGWLNADATKIVIDNPATLAMLKLMRELWETHGVNPTQKEYSEIGLLPIFQNGRCAMYVGGTWGLDPFRQAAFDWDIVEVPSLVVGGRRVKGAFLGVEEIFVVDGTPNEGPAADFAAWLVGPEHLRWAGSQGHIIPALSKVAQEVFVPPSSDPRPKNQQAFVRAAQYAPPIIPHPEYTNLSRAYNTAVAEWLGPEAKLPAEAALQKAQRDMQVILDEWNRKNP